MARIDGVPVPAGIAQVRVFTCLRKRALLPHDCDPAKLYAEDEFEPDSDHLQRRAFRIDLRGEIAMLTDALAAGHIDLFLAMWLRDFAGVEQHLDAALATGWMPSFPGLEKIADIRERFLLAWAIRCEIERLVDIMAMMAEQVPVTLTGLHAALAGSTALSRVVAVDDPTSRILSCSWAHARLLFPEMNLADDANSVVRDDTDLDQCVLYRKALDGTAAFEPGIKARKFVAGQNPVANFQGVELELLPLVALIEMAEGLPDAAGRPKGSYTDGAGPEEIRAVVATTSTTSMLRCEVVGQLAAILLGNISPATCRRLLNIPASPTPDLMAADLRDALDDLEDRSFDEPYRRALERAKLCTRAYGEPGRPIGFRPRAWLSRDANTAFLDRCLDPIEYDAALAAAREDAIRELRTTGTLLGLPKLPANGITIFATPRLPGAFPVWTGLPKEHPVVDVQDRFSECFERAGPASRRLAVEAARRLYVGGTPMNLDPEHWGRINRPVTRLMRQIALQVDWACVEEG